jgi:hypothetical protein
VRSLLFVVLFIILNISLSQAAFAAPAICSPTKVIQKSLVRDAYLPAVSMEANGFWIILYVSEYQYVLLAIDPLGECILSEGIIVNLRGFSI